MWPAFQNVCSLLIISVLLEMYADTIISCMLPNETTWNKLLFFKHSFKLKNGCMLVLFTEQVLGRSQQGLSSPMGTNVLVTGYSAEFIK